jgi:hypothetical protein
MIKLKNSGVSQAVIEAMISACAESSTSWNRRRLKGRVEKRSETLKPVAPNVLSAICVALVIILVIETTGKRERKFPDKT